MAEERDDERRPTAPFVSTSGSKGAGPAPVNPSDGQSMSEADKDAIIVRLHKQVDEKTSKIGELSVEVSDLKRELADAGRKLSETEAKAEETEQRRASLATALSEVQTELAQAKANTALFEGRVGTLEDQLRTAWDEKDKLAQELAAAKVLNPDVSREEKLEKALTRIGELETELAVAKAARTEAEETAKAAKAEVEKIKTDSDSALTASIGEAQEIIGDLESKIKALRTKLVKTQDKYYDILSKGQGLSVEYLKQIETLKQELAGMQVRAEKAEAPVKTKTARADKAEESVDVEAGWYADGAGSGAPSQPTDAVPAAKPGIVKRLFGRKEE